MVGIGEGVKRYKKIRARSVSKSFTYINSFYAHNLGSYYPFLQMKQAQSNGPI